jgi:hypothetical protein
VLNAGRQIAFSLGGKKYELTLVEKREKKAWPFSPNDV